MQLEVLLSCSQETLSGYPDPHESCEHLYVFRN
jgi:hypothetical protein